MKIIIFILKISYSHQSGPYGTVVRVPKEIYKRGNNSYVSVHPDQLNNLNLQLISRPLIRGLESRRSQTGTRLYPITRMRILRTHSSHYAGEIMTRWRTGSLTPIRISRSQFWLQQCPASTAKHQGGLPKIQLHCSSGLAVHCGGSSFIVMWGGRYDQTSNAQPTDADGRIKYFDAPVHRADLRENRKAFIYKQISILKVIVSVNVLIINYSM